MIGLLGSIFHQKIIHIGDIVSDVSRKQNIVKEENIEVQ